MNKAFGDSLPAYWRGNLEAMHIIERDDGYKQEVLVEYLFKKRIDWPKEETYKHEV